MSLVPESCLVKLIKFEKKLKHNLFSLPGKIPDSYFVDLVSSFRKRIVPMKDEQLFPERKETGKLWRRQRRNPSKL
jgi:hypothetical protein